MSNHLSPNFVAVVINLDRSDFRMNQMGERLSKIGLEFKRFAAVDGKKDWDQISKHVDFSRFTRNVGGGVMPGEVGCYLSHLRVWTEYAESELDAVLVIEDDVQFGPDFMEAVETAIANKHLWDILKLNRIRAKQPITQHRISKWFINAYLGPATGTGAYLIQPSTIRRLLPKMLPITNPIDREFDLIHKHDLRLFGMEPFPSWIDDAAESTITGKQFSGSLKYRWYKRLPCYAFRLSNLFKRITYLYRMNRLRPQNFGLATCDSASQPNRGP